MPISSLILAASVAGSGFWQTISKALRMQNAMPCVGLVVLAGCLTFVIAPDDQPSVDSRISAALDPALPTIVIDPGHGGIDDGAKGNGLVEKEITLDLAFRVEQLLKTFGFKTILTRRDDTYLTLAERAAIANHVEHSFFVSLHFNKSPYAAASGVETYYATEKVAPEADWSWVGYFSKPVARTGADNGETLAGYIQTALVNRTETGNRGIKARELYVVRHTRAPAVLIEAGFLSNSFDARLLGAPEYRDRLAAAIVEGVIQFHKTQPRPKTPTQLAKAMP
jgi:N-acetylmuramoyl-L-alanine amidase